MPERHVLTGPPLYKPLTEKSLGEQIYDSLLKNRNQDLFIDGVSGERTTYGDYLEATCRLAECFKNIGLKPNDMITISSENTNYFFQPVVAALYLGIIIAPINHSYIESELFHVLNLSKPKIVFCSAARVPKFISVLEKCPSIERIIVLDLKGQMGGVESLQNFMATNCDKYIDENGFKPSKLIQDHLAAVLCSSGTSGLPKCVMTTHKNINVRVNHSTDPRLNISALGATKLGLMPFFHGYGFISILSAIIIGERVIVLPRFDENLFLASIQNYNITDIWIAPPIVVFLAKSPLVKEYDLSSITEIVSSAAPLGEQIEEEAIKRLHLKHIRQGYGLSEATLAIILMPPNEKKPGCSGVVVPGMSVKLRDPENYESVGPHTVGEICIKGPMVTNGYYNNPKATKEMFTSDGWLLTGDLAYYDEGGYFYIVDRLKELIKYKGFQVAPAELESLLLKHQKIKDAAVVGLPDEVAGELPLAFVVKQPGIQLSEDEVKKFVADNISHSKHLRGGVRFIDAIPKNPSGKILRRTLRELVRGVRSKL